MKNIVAAIHTLVCVWAWCFPSVAQTLTFERHCPQATDSIMQYAMVYQTMMDTGRNCVWDFSKERIFEEIQSLVCHSIVQPGTTQFTKHRLHSRHNYQTIGDTIYCTGYENANMRVTYTDKEKILVFPFGYADTLYSAFGGKGEYAHCDMFSIQGGSTTICDGVGKLLLPIFLPDNWKRPIYRKDYGQYCRIVHLQAKRQRVFMKGILVKTRLWLLRSITTKIAT